MGYYEDTKLTICGDSLAECKQKLSDLYGHNWKIIDQENKTVPYGLFKMRKKMQKVVTYVVEHHNVYNSGSGYGDVLSEEERLERNKQQILQAQQDVFMKAQINQMSQTLEEMRKDMNRKLEGMQSVSGEKHPTITKIAELLGQNEFTYNYIQMIEEKIKATFPLDQLDDFKLVQRYVVDWIGESISIAPEKVFRPPHVIIIVGPTGVGKTTTIAKLASNTILDARANGQPKPELCIITIDTMRVGALEQISRFGEILGKNVMKAESSTDVLKIYDQYKDHTDFIFIDTSGYSPNDSSHIAEMKNILDVDGLNADVYLSITGSTKASDLNVILRNYEPMAYESVIITKADETKQIGNVISVLYEKHKSISYITDGQQVPHNIRRATVVDILKSLNGFDIDRIHIEDKFGEK